jgi:hypothetical protein
MYRTFTAIAAATTTTTSSYSYELPMPSPRSLAKYVKGFVASEGSEMEEAKGFSP